MSSASRHAIYPRCCFHLSPTYNAWCILKAAEVHGLKQHAGFEGQDFYFYKNLPIRWARAVGVVVAIDEFPGTRAFTIDDSSGLCIEAVARYTAPKKVDAASGIAKGTAATDRDAASVASRGARVTEPDQTGIADLPYSEIDVGAVVDVKGRLTTFRGEMQIKIEKMVEIRTTADEVALWEKREKFRIDVLNVPWVLRDKDVRRARKEAERSEADVDRKQKRIKAAAERVALGSSLGSKPMVAIKKRYS